MKDYLIQVSTNSFNDKHTLSTDWNEVVWSAITVGKRNSSQMIKHGKYSIYEMVNRISLIYMALDLNANYLSKTPVYKEMDPSEKVYVSFFLGMTMSKLFAFRLLGVPWLEHVSNVNNLITTSIATRSRPDLIGINTRNEFLIFEAKGRTNGFSRATQNKAKEQTKVINTICGRLPVLRVAVQSYFNNQLEVYVEDPDEIEKVPIDIEFTKEHYFNSYYSLFLELKELDYRALNYVGVEVSFSKQLDEVIKSRNFSMIEPESEKAEFDKEGFKCFPDGLKIRLDPSVWPINA